jgi:hypothetical protein
VTRTSLLWLSVALAGLIGWVVGVGAYVNWFSETGRAGSDVLKVAMWSSGLLGLVALLGFGFSIRGGNRA